MTEKENRHLQIAIEIAQQAGALLLEYFGKLSREQIRYKGKRDVVTAADHAAEELIVANIEKYFPDHSILAEENTDRQGQAPYRWFIDPLDGTGNFSHAHPFFAVSMGLAHADEMEMGIVYAPKLDELYYATKEKGAYLTNGNLQSPKQLSVSQVDDLKDSLLATGFAYKRTAWPGQENDQMFLQLLDKCQGIRRCGAAALDLCYVAHGRYEAFWEVGLQSYDVAAGSLIVKEAGGKVGEMKLDCQQHSGYLWRQNILASNAKLHGELSKILALPKTFSL